MSPETIQSKLLESVRYNHKKILVSDLMAPSQVKSFQSTIQKTDLPNISLPINLPELHASLTHRAQVKTSDQMKRPIVTKQKRT